MEGIGLAKKSDNWYLYFLFYFQFMFWLYIIYLFKFIAYFSIEIWKINNLNFESMKKGEMQITDIVVYLKSKNVKFITEAELF